MNDKRYLDSCNGLYKAAIARAVTSIKTGVRHNAGKAGTNHPILLLKRSLVAPLHVMFNFGHDAIPRMIIKKIHSERSPIGAITAAAQASPLILNTHLEGSDETLSEQLESLSKVILPHAYLIHGGYIEDCRGGSITCSALYKQLKEPREHVFDGKLGLATGYYLFVGDKPQLIISGAPTEKRENILDAGSNTLSKLPALKDELNFIETSIEANTISTIGVSLVDEYEKAKSLQALLKNYS